MLKLKLVRFALKTNATIGMLYVDGEPGCFTLEDCDRLSLGLKKVPGKTAIPLGTYQVQITDSKRFQRKLPEIIGVKGFTAVRIHPGNTDVDTSGCVLPAYHADLVNGVVAASRGAFQWLFTLMEAASTTQIDISLLAQDPAYIAALKKKITDLDVPLVA